MANVQRLVDFAAIFMKYAQTLAQANPDLLREVIQQMLNEMQVEFTMTVNQQPDGSFNVDLAVGQGVRLPDIQRFVEDLIADKFPGVVANVNAHYGF